MPKEQQSQKRRTDQREERNGECKTHESENSAAATRAEEEEEEESERDERHLSQGYDGGTTVPARNGGARKQTSVRFRHVIAPNVRGNVIVKTLLTSNPE